MTSARHWPVVVVGGGPTGLTTANLLAFYGIPVLMIERNPSTVGEPRAVSIDDETLRTVQTFGAVQDVLSQVVLGYGSDYYSTSGYRFLQVKPTTQDYGYPKRNAFRQPIFEAQLASHLAKQANAEMWFNTELISVVQDEEKVTLRIRRADKSETEVSCSYFVGCDGARSFVRESLGIRLNGSTFRERWLIIDLDRTVDSTQDTKVFCNPDRPCITLPGPNGTRRYEFMLQKDETEGEATAPETVARLLRNYGPDEQSPICRKAVYTFHARVADRWSKSRIFLAGDAAHVSPPFAGQGMNSVIRDANNIAWKLAAVITNQLGPKLLESYEQERRKHAWEMILLAMRMGYVMMPRSRVTAAMMQAAFRALRLCPPARDYFGQMKYKPKPYFRTGFLSRDNAPASASKIIGRLFPQPLVTTPAGSSLLDDVLGPSFALVTTPATPAAIFDDLPGDFGASQHMRRVAIVQPGASVEVPYGVLRAEDSTGSVLSSFGRLSRGFLLLRPDRYVAAFLPADKLEEAVACIERLFAATWTEASGTPSQGGVLPNPELQPVRARDSKAHA